MPQFAEARAHTLAVLQRELVGPDPQGEPFDPESDVVDEGTRWMPRRQELNGEEILTRDAPDRRYGVGVIYSAGCRDALGQEVVAGDGPPDEPLGEAEPKLVANKFLVEAESARDGLGDSAPTDDLDLSGANEFRPTTMAVTFLAELPSDATVRLTLKAGRYKKRTIRVGRHDRVWWFRNPCSVEVKWDASQLMARSGRHEGVATAEGLEGLEIGAFAVSRPREDETSLITVGVINSTPGCVPECFLFQAEFEVEVSGSSDAARIRPYPQPVHAVRDEEEKSIDLLYRVYPTFAVGHGCAAGWAVRFPSGRCSSVRGEPLPVVETPSVTPQVFREDGSELRIPMAPLAGLIEGEDGIASLAEVIDLYETWIAERERDIRELEQGHQGTALRHLAECSAAAHRMREGLTLVRGSRQVRDAFVLANRAVLLQQVHSAGTTRELIYDARTKQLKLAEPKRPTDPLSPPAGRGAWRPFQIAFLLSAIASCANPHHPDRELVDLIFFPTGGGKTEAYLGLSAFNVLLRRLRDPEDAGVDVLMRYTLRLLTAQQFQRAAALVCALEIIRAERIDLGAKPFSIGIWVGGGTSPNTRKQALTDLRNLRAGRGSNPFLVIRCPWCAAQIGPGREQGRQTRGSRPPLVHGYAEAAGTVRIFCTDTTCEFSDGLPLHVIDEDIYDHCPSIVIGTVDKFAQLAWRSDTRSLFGVGDSGAHAVSPPGLIIQDELHLISGPLGSMVGLYESVIEELCVDRRGEKPVRPKIVSSTATIRRYTDQVRSLFARERVALFPPHGISVDDSFFARYARYRAPHLRADELCEGRMYVGVHGAGLGSLQTAQVRAFSALLQAGRDLPADERDPYWTLMVFFNSLRELGTSLSLLQSDIPDYMKVIRNRRGSSWDDVRRLNRELELTGRLRNDEVPTVMEALETPYADGRGSVDICLASNIIEVGIDIDRLSLMAVVGQPKSTSQYIQVTGRVGRRWDERPGLIATIYSASKPRDRSHYEKFRTYHERLYAQVEPTSVTPFAPPVLARALHAALVAWVRQRAPRDEASSPYPIPEDLIEMASSIFRERVATVDIEETAALEQFLTLRIEEWARWVPSEWRRSTTADEPGLLYRAGEYADPEERVRSWATPTSLRNVDAECRGVITGVYALGLEGDTA
ncbi:helicase-related protein [Candidatus Poriferisodalis sp.]|uniref:helicase-related protein n=1 Tax=Candidatus Poriferisodalis sp. TaxID=3101277 RepID=UPI003D13A220